MQSFGQPRAFEGGQVVGATGTVGQFVERTGGEQGNEVERAARVDMGPEASPDPLVPERGDVPAVRVPVLALDLVDLGSPVMAIDELDAVAQEPPGSKVIDVPMPSST